MRNLDIETVTDQIPVHQSYNSTIGLLKPRNQKKKVDTYLYNHFTHLAEAHSSLKRMNLEGSGNELRV